MKVITTDQLNSLSVKACNSTRKRAHHNIHELLEDPIQRLFVAIEPESYVRPHRHCDPVKWELDILIKGSLLALEFSDDGAIKEKTLLDTMSGACAIEIAGGAWHAVVALEPGTIFFELKPGPYIPLPEIHFASWAPKEGDPTCGEIIKWYRDGEVGSRSVKFEI